MRVRAGQEVSDYFVDAFTSTYQFHRASEISLGALLGIMHSIQKDQPRWYLHRTQGGMQALPDALASRLDVRVGTPVVSVTASATSVSLATQATQETFDAVVLAAQAPMSLAMYQNPSPLQHRVLCESTYASTISVAFRVDRTKVPDTAVVWVPYVESDKISGYVNEAMKGEEVTQDGKTLISTWLHEGFAKEIMEQSDAQIFSAVRAELARVCPWVSGVQDLTPHDLQRWPLAMPKFSHGHLSMIKDFFERPDGQGANNVFLCGDYLNSPWTEGALRGGQRVAKDILQRA